MNLADNNDLTLACDYPLQQNQIPAYILRKKHLIRLAKPLQVYVDDDYCLLRFSEPQKSLSSAILNGGFNTVKHVLNLKVEASSANHEAAELTLQKKLQALQADEQAIAMMTAASMNSVRIVQTKSANCHFTVCISCGLGNARCAGDKADLGEFAQQQEQELGTINMVLWVDKPLSDAAMVEAMMMMTEAKATALQQISVTSPISGQWATGTGTDSCAVMCPQPQSGTQAIEYVGKHLHLGQQLARAVIAAVASAAAYEL